MRYEFTDYEWRPMASRQQFECPADRNFRRRLVRGDDQFEGAAISDCPNPRNYCKIGPSKAGAWRRLGLPAARSCA